jgi:hypothetical protein
MKTMFVDKRHLRSHNSIMQAPDPMSVRYPFVRLSSKMTSGLDAWKPRSCRGGLVASPALGDLDGVGIEAHRLDAEPPNEYGVPSGAC